MKKAFLSIGDYIHSWPDNGKDMIILAEECDY